MKWLHKNEGTQFHDFAHVSSSHDVCEFQQAAYNIDNSAEIRDLEQKRAQIFFEALEQQHK